MENTGSVPPGWKGAALGLLVTGMGGIILSIGLGLFPVPEEGIHAPLWVVAAAGLAFLFAGISVVQQALQIERFKHVPGLLILLALTAVANWAAFGGGDRNGEGNLTVVGITMPVSSEVAGRIGFGFGAVVMDLLIILGLVRWLRSGIGSRTTSPRRVASTR